MSGEPSPSLPAGFRFGAATSAFQIEGASGEDGRGESIWDRMAATPGLIEDGSDATVACDHYHRWREDIGHMQWLGLDSYRFSVSWARVLPEGRGAPNAAGLDFYESLVDGLLEAGITPFLTLNHWDMPQALMEQGGWAGRDTVDRFVEYAGHVAARLGDRVAWWTTHNEPWCVAHLGYEQGAHAPALQDPAKALRAAHHLMLSHGRAVQALRSARPEARLGIVLNLTPARPATDDPADIGAAHWFDGFFNRWYLDPLFRGQYPEDAVEDRRRRGQLPAGEMPFVEPGDLAEIAVPLDYLGVNYYSEVVMEAGPDGGPRGVAPAPPVTEMGWALAPEAMAPLLRRLRDEYGVGPIYITECGAAFPDEADEGGVVHDDDRTNFLREHLAQVELAIASGVDVRGFFTWSLLDNFEWGHGYTKRFGLFRVDYATCERTPKDSARWYRELIAAHRARRGGGAPAGERTS